MVVKIKSPEGVRMDKLPLWAKNQIEALEREVQALKGLLDEIRTGREEADFSYIDVRQPTKLSRDRPIFLPKHVLQVTALNNTLSPIDMRVVTEGTQKFVSISTAGLATALQVLPRAANMVYVTGINR